MRIDKYISNNTELSRKEVRQLLHAGSISLNDERVRNAATKVSGEHDLVAINGKPITPIGNVYYMLHKPAGYVCANTDGNHPTVIDLLSDKTHCNDGRPITNTEILNQLQVVGRLDIDTTGLVLLTNDGNWNHRITSPKSHCVKSYLVTLASPLSPDTQQRFADGVQLEGEKKKTQPAFFEQITSTRVKLAIREGKYHQVKRMFAAMGNRVTQLHRDSIGPIHLDAHLAQGQYRALLPREVKNILNNPLLIAPEDDA